MLHKLSEATTRVDAVIDKATGDRLSAYSVVRRVLGAALVVAGGLKGYSLAGEGAMGIAGWLQLALFEFEIFAGMWLFVGIAASATRWAALAWFTWLAFVAAYQGLAGAGDCGCLGVLSVNPWLMFGVDVGAVVCLVSFRPRGDKLGSRSGTRKFLGRVVITALATAAVGYAIAFITFGSPVLALAWLRGESVLVTPDEIDLGTLRSDEERTIYFQVTNLAERPVTLVGGSTSCTCVTTGDLPLTIPRGESRSVPIVFRAGGTPRKFVQTVTLYADGEYLRPVHGRIRGCIEQASGS